MLNLKNSFIFAPIKTGYGNKEGLITEKHLAFYKRRAAYLGAIISEPLYMNKSLRELPTQIGIDNDNKIEGLKKLTAVLHETNTKAIAHLNHPGRMANPKIPGNEFYSSTAKACEAGGPPPKKMTKKDIVETVELFENSAIRSEKAGFDIIELQFGHGYLAAQFISPQVNDRDDEYGGSFENRIRFPLEILKAVKDAVSIPIIVRISGDEMIPGGIKLEEMIKFAKILKESGVEAIHVSAGTICSTPPWFFQHMFVPKGKTWEFAKKIKDAIDIPVIYVGQINSIDDINDLKEKYKTDYLAIGRALLADPDFIGKFQNKVAGNIRPCLACEEGCLGGVKSGTGLSCLVNPQVGREEKDAEASAQSKNYAVVGGGLAGMQAAVTLKQRGNDVTIYEKEQLGGQFNFAPLTPHKQSMKKLIPYFVNELNALGINVIFKEANKTHIKGKYDGVILATGSVPSVPAIEGLKKYYWADILLEYNLPRNKKVLIIGGGLIGVDIATALIPKGNEITIVKRSTDFGEDMEMIAKKLSLKMMKENNTVFSDHTHIKKIDGKIVYAERNGKNIQFDDIDIIVVSSGMKSHNPLEKELTGDLPVYVIGDAKKVGDAQDAISDGYNLAMSL